MSTARKKQWRMKCQLLVKIEIMEHEVSTARKNLNNGA